MKKSILFFVFTALLLAGCDPTGAEPDYVAEIRDTEAKFEQMAAEKGVKEAFLHFAADDAVLNRNNQIISGKEAIAAHFDEQPLTDIVLLWEPDFIDVAASGDLAYTYGKFSFSATRDDGEPLQASGVFHTVWKRQPDGSWKYVYD